MASANIPEEIIGVPLFVPSANNFFSIDAGGMPNGDDCLNVLGATSRDHKAFMSAPVTSPNISADGTVWAMSFWISGPVGGWTSNSIIMSIENTNASVAPGIASPTRLWSIFCNGTTGALNVLRGGYSASSSYYFSIAVMPNMPGAADWTFVVINFPATSGAFTVGRSFNNDNPNSIGATTQSQTWTFNPNMFLSIGGYANAIGANQDYRIGKLAFHDHQLTETERLLLYNGMVA